MDTGKTYIAMCREARTIQESWLPMWGDWYSDESWWENGELIIKAGFTSGVARVDVLWLNKHGSNLGAYIGKFIFLPDQSQLQKMLLKIIPHGKTFSLYMNNDGCFGVWIGSVNYCRQANTVEQALLKALMRRKYEKVWNDKTWITKK